MALQHAAEGNRPVFADDRNDRRARRERQYTKSHSEIGERPTPAIRRSRASPRRACAASRMIVLLGGRMRAPEGRVLSLSLDNANIHAARGRIDQARSKRHSSRGAGHLEGQYSSSTGRWPIRRRSPFTRSRTSWTSTSKFQLSVSRSIDTPALTGSFALSKTLAACAGHGGIGVRAGARARQQEGGGFRRSLSGRFACRLAPTESRLDLVARRHAGSPVRLAHSWCPGPGSNRHAV